MTGRFSRPAVSLEISARARYMTQVYKTWRSFAYSSSRSDKPSTTIGQDTPPLNSLTLVQPVSFR